MVHVQACLTCFYANPIFQYTVYMYTHFCHSGSTTSDGNGYHLTASVVGGVVSLVIVLISAVVIILLLLVIRKRRLTEK